MSKLVRVLVLVIGPAPPAPAIYEYGTYSNRCVAALERDEWAAGDSYTRTSSSIGTRTHSHTRTSTNI
eukprot:scaffold265848_cov13-Prasinocladus_malaysianus.AAC.2